ncbi:MAG: phosphate ABC transporter permease PstA [Bacteroidota bacterium]|nr:phosphate ABC transporter permease PstA [Bacteroidota bacterium]MDP4233110.1 phosphate ABC transporter permease PstA [Bacteroidota bacterium]MDP4241745.1 phosphate ABC transporter permease PstA [Bacteroidota bacterium]MDP4287403.1 phosphate ABC transporter permease PstA [Bacteroidota bacterium]
MTETASLFRPTGRSRFRRSLSAAMAGISIAAAIIACVALLSVLVYIVINGVGSMSLSVFTEGPVPMGQPGGGLRNAIVGTLILMSIGSVIGLPIGILGGVYQLETNTRFSRILRFFTDVLNSIPSIVMGLFAYLIVVLPVAQISPGHAFSAFAGGVALGFLMIPTVMRTTEEILRLVPTTLRDASLALGASRWRTTWSVILPAARGGIVTGVLLALARIAGETAPLLFTAFGNLDFNMRLDRPIDALPLNIFNYATSPYENLHHLALAGAIILLAIILILSLAARWALRGHTME